MTTACSLLCSIHVSCYLWSRHHRPRERPASDCPAGRDGHGCGSAPGAAGLLFATPLRLSIPSPGAENRGAGQLDKGIRSADSVREIDHAAYCHGDAALFVRGIPVVLYFRALDVLPRRCQDGPQRVLWQNTASAGLRCGRLAGLGVLPRCSRSLFPTTLEKTRGPRASVASNSPLLFTGSCITHAT